MGDGTPAVGPTPEQRVHLALLRASALNGINPVTDEELCAALPEMAPAEITLELEHLVRDDVVRRIPEGWVLRGHGSAKPSSRSRLLSH